VSDAQGGSSTATVMVVVTGSDRTGPIANADTGDTDEGSPADIGVLDNDIIGNGANGLVVRDTGVLGNNQGTATTNGTTVTYTPPDDDFNGPVTISYTVCDNGVPELCDTSGQVALTVNPVNDQPEIQVVPTQQLSVVGQQNVTLNLRDMVTIQDVEEGNCPSCTFKIRNMPPNLTIDNDVIRGDIATTASSRGNSAQGGFMYDVEITVTDSENAESEPRLLNWRVMPSPVAPADNRAAVEIDGESDDGGDLSPLEEAACRLVDLNGNDMLVDGLPVTTTTDSEGRFVFTIPVAPGLDTPAGELEEGFIECNPPDNPLLTISTYFTTRGLRRGERLTGLTVQPATTVCRDVFNRLALEAPETDLVAVQARFMEDIAGLQTQSPTIATGEDEVDVECEENNESGVMQRVVNSIDIPLSATPNQINQNNTAMTAYIASQLFLSVFKESNIVSNLENLGVSEPLRDTSGICSILPESDQSNFRGILQTYLSRGTVVPDDLISLGMSREEGVQIGADSPQGCVF
jgi:hypothetical protein